MLNKIANINISIESAAIQSATFDVALILDEFNTFTDRVRVYSDAASILSDGFAESSPVYKAAEKMFSQENSPASVKVGRKDALETITEALNAINLEDSAWYMLLLCERTAYTDVEDAATWTESNEKVFIYATSDSDSADLSSGSDATSTLAKLKDLNLSRTGVMFHKDNTEYPDSGLAGVLLVKDPGSYTAEYKTISGVSSSKLSTTQINNVSGKNGMLYIKEYGRSVTRNTKVLSGEWLDVIIFRDWLKARLAERIARLQFESEKIPYTDEGIGCVEAVVREVLDIASQPPYSGIDSYTVTVPEITDIPESDRQERKLTGVTFTARLSGAIHTTTINGYINF